MASQQATAPAAVQYGGQAALADKVLTGPEHGAGYYFPPTALGTPLALAGFGFGLAMLSIINTEWVALGTLGIMVPIALGYAALATIVGGLWDFRSNNLFGAVWAVSYGGFWISLALLLQYFSPGIVETAGAAAFSDAFGAYLLIWAVVTAYLTVAAYFVARQAFICFALLFVVFVLLAFSNIVGPDSPAEFLRKLGGYVGIIDALLAFYLSAAFVINATAGRTLLKLRPYPYDT